MKPHTDKVVMIVALTEKNLIATGSIDKTMFFFAFVTTEKGIDMDPIRCIKLDYVSINFEFIKPMVRFGVKWLNSDWLSLSRDA